ncbi:PREDICTED: uncharacterized protein LOC108756586 [Trachymyrmex septentrionalis]|uniref:uncharacterized protein LOC108756586 n=1 Tax=Trachymyrmex septentrionalis TaxID=34720 RepID=UPI00084EEAEA|nr:PREDICTED: uncharacterized protein LOC108756586 [Trachymyrmex septentrionalis]
MKLCEADKQRTQRHYFENNDFPGVIASIDDSHIDKSSENSVVYINRKHYFSIHMQGTVNEKKKFLDVFVGYPGSVHNARVLLVWLKTCQHFVKMEAYFLVNTPYPCLP